MKNGLALFGILFLSFGVNQASAQDIQFNRYHTQEEINQFMRDEAAKYPKFIQFKILGKSEQGREVSYVMIGTRPGAPAFYFNGTHHGDEWSSTESILGLIDYLANHAFDAKVSALLNSYTFYLQPLVNPDGHFAQNRMDPHGRDPNRDYSWSGRSDADSFKIPVIVLVKNLLAEIKPRAAAAYHSGIEEVLWSWCYTNNATPDASTFLQITKKTAQAMGFTRYMQSYFDYVTDGEFIDYAYTQYHTTALTFEVSTVKTPAAADLPAVVQRSILGAMAFIEAIQDKDLGLIPSKGNSEYEAAKRTWTPSADPVRLE